MVGDEAETGSLERRFPRLQAGNSAASVTVLDLDPAPVSKPGTHRIHPQLDFRLLALWIPN